MTLLTDEALAGFFQEVKRLSAHFPFMSQLAALEDCGQMFALGLTGNEEVVGHETYLDPSEHPFALLLPEAVYGVIQERWYKQGETIDPDALRALFMVSDLVTPIPYFSPRDLLDAATGDGFSPLIEETLDALIMGEQQYGLEGFFELLETVENNGEESLLDELQPALWMNSDCLRELAELHFKTTDTARAIRDLMAIDGVVTPEQARNAAERAPDELRERLEAILALRAVVERLAPDPGPDAGIVTGGAVGSFCGLPTYPGLMEACADEHVDMPLMQGGERCFMAFSGSAPECVRHLTLQVFLFMAFLHLVADFR